MKPIKQVLFSFVPKPFKQYLKSRLQSAKNACLVGFQKYLGRLGYTLARNDDHYSPLTPVSHLKANRQRWDHPSALVGIEYDLEKMKKDLDDLLELYLDEFLTIPDYRQIQKVGFGPGYTALDALTLYLMIRHIKPRRYIEVGSGVSTYYCSLAAARNASEGYPLDMICIEPKPFEKLYSIPGIQVIPKEVQDVPETLFQQLEKDDILFIDSSHVLKIDGDVPFLYLEILPRLNVGVVVHIHDIAFPYNIPYPPQLWVFGQVWPRLWNEAMMLQAFLCFNDRFKITMSTPLIRHHDEPFIRKKIPGYESVEQNPNTFSSIWLRRVC